MYVTGITGGDLDGAENTGSLDAYLSKYNSDGARVWTRLLPSNRTDVSFATATSIDGSIYIVGKLPDAAIVKYNADGTTAWTQSIGLPLVNVATSVTVADDGTVYVAGYTTGSPDGEISNGSGDAFLAKYNSDGSRQWTRLFGTGYQDGAHSVTTSADGFIYITGFAGYGGRLNSSDKFGGNLPVDATSDGFLAKYNSSGLLVWSRSFNSAFADFNGHGNSVATTSDGLVYVVGIGGGGYLATFNSSGTVLDKKIIDPLGTQPYSVDTDNSGAVIIAGGTSPDAFIARYTINAAPNEIALSQAVFNENIVAASTVATLSSTDPDTGDTFTYALVSGTGDTDNGAFSIDGNQLKINASPDFETKSSYSIRVRTTDAGGLTFEKVLIFDVNDLPENGAPNDITLTSSGIQENSTAGTLIGTLAATDPDAGTTFTYALVPGNGTNDIDNDLVEIVGNEVRVKAATTIDFETNPLLNLNIQVTDNGTPGLSFTKAVTVNVLDVNETGGSPGGSGGTTSSGGGGGGGGNISSAATPVDQSTTNTSPSQQEDKVINGTQDAVTGIVVEKSYSKKDPPDPITLFDPQSSVLKIDTNALGAPEDKLISFKATKSAKKVKKLARSESNLIYNKKDGYVYFNANREEPGFGPGGGLIAVLQPRLDLSGSNFVII